MADKRKKTSAEMTDAEYDNFLKTGEAPDADEPESKKKTKRGDEPESKKKTKRGGLRDVFEKHKKIEKELFGD